MAAYVIANIEVTNPGLMGEYAAKAKPTVEAHGGKAIVLGAEADVVEGDWRPNRLVVIEFPDMAAAKGWYNSAEYQEILPMRLEASNGDFVMVEGA
ncbi:MAG: DUF1330 domain-containing protein [Proteobacteria bacterium]|nr:DUF1330 domain-containing protein [Pseudomonadota bacterium]MDA1354949.1 DUF1330 domain-containing protein [Pseudomonadota bacterium]